jgi:arabinose-5-phosphate isomerase
MDASRDPGPTDPRRAGPEAARDADAADGEDRIARRARRARAVLEIEGRAITSVAEQLGPAFSEAVERVLACQGMVVVTGVGKAGLVGAKISATLASTGTPSLCLHPADALHGDLGRIRPQDVLLALSNSGETVELRSLVPAVRRIGAGLIALTRSRSSTLGRLADCVLELGPLDEACPLGLAPTASTSAMLALGDALAMVVLEERGFGRDEYALYHPAGALGRRLMRVGELMRRGEELPIAPSGSSLREVLEITNRTPGRPGAALIVDGDGRLLGIFTDGDLRRLLDRVESRPREAPIDDHMGRHPKAVRADQLVEEAMALLQRHRIDQLPVVDEAGRPVGLLDIQDVLDLRM